MTMMTAEEYELCKDTPEGQRELAKVKLMRLCQAIHNNLEKNCGYANEHGCIQCSDSFEYLDKGYVLTVSLKPREA